MYSVFTRQKGHHEPLQRLNGHKNHTNISTAPCICRPIQGTDIDKEVVTPIGSRWQHYPRGPVSSHGWPLECADILFIDGVRELWKQVSFAIKEKCRYTAETKWDDFWPSCNQTVTLERLSYTIRIQYFWVASSGLVNKPSSQVFFWRPTSEKYLCISLSNTDTYINL